LGEDYTHVLHSDHFGLRNENKHSILESVMWSITDKKYLFKLFRRTMEYGSTTEKRAEELRDSLIGW